MIFWGLTAVVLIASLICGLVESKGSLFRVSDIVMMSILSFITIGIVVGLILGLIATILSEKYNWEKVEEYTLSETAVVDASDSTITFTADGKDIKAKLKNVTFNGEGSASAVRTDKEARYPLIWPFGPLDRKPTHWDLTFPEDTVRLKL